MVPASVHDVIVVGGGLAGCATAIGLRRRGADVLLLEASTYPADKLCGEFLSPEGQGLLGGLGVLDRVWSRGAVPINRVRITECAGGQHRADLPGVALGVSRRTLDSLLFDAVRAAGGVALSGAQAQDVRQHPEDEGGGHTVRYLHDDRPREARAALVVGAYGKRARLDRALGRGAGERHPFVAFKAHHQGDPAVRRALHDTIELHTFPGGYCGMSRVEGGAINLCALLRAESLRAAGRTYEGLRNRLMAQNPQLAERLAQLRQIGALLSIGQVSLLPKQLFCQGVMMVGDTTGMISPLCGDGMAMALRGAELAVPLIADYLRHRLTLDEVADRYQRAYEDEFRQRLLIGRALQEVLLRPGLLRVSMGLLSRIPGLSRELIRRTREPHATA